MTAAGTPMSGAAAAWAEAQVRVHEALHPHQKRRADERLTGWLEGFEATMADAVRPHLAQWADHPDVPDEVKHLIGLAIDPQQQFGVSILFAIVGALAYPLVAAMMSGPAAQIQDASMSKFLPTNLSPAEAALAVVRHTGEPGAMANEAAQAGVPGDLFNIMVRNTGDSPAVGDLLLAYRRGIIDRGRLQLGIRQSRMRDEWEDVIFALRYQPPSVGEALAGAVQGHITPAEGQAHAENSGLDPAEWGWLLETAGRPPGTESMLELMNRGLMSEAEVRQAIRESDIKNKYIDQIIQSAAYIPPVRSIMPMLRSGAVDDARATQMLRQQGVQDVDIPAYLAEGHHTRSGSVKQLSASLVVRMYENRLMDAGTATTRLTNMGYSAQDAALHLQFADDQRHEKAVNAVVSRIHSLYVAHKIDATDVTNDLSGAGIPGAAISDYLHLWGLERAANVHKLSPAAIVGAYRRQEISAANCKTRLQQIGVQDQDIHIVVADAWPPTKPNPAAVAAVVNA